MILDTVYRAREREGRCTPHRPGEPPHALFTCDVQQPPCDTSTEEVCSFGKRDSATSVFSCEEFLEARCEVKKPKSH